MECLARGLGSLHMGIIVNFGFVVGAFERTVHIQLVVVVEWPFLVGLLEDRILVEVCMSTHCW